MSTALDARALAGLDELLMLAAPEREHRLLQWRSTDPVLHARISALWRAAEMTQASRRLADVAGEFLALPAPSWAAGQQVGGYRLLRELGQGGMSRVWLAERLEGGLTRPVALKLPLQQARAGELAERFGQERELLAALDHPNIARLYDAGIASDGHPYLVLEFVDGQPLTDHARRHGLDQAARLALFDQVMAAVQHAHAHMVVHRDLKPGNILVDAHGQVKLLDFGIAKLLAPQADTSPLTRPAGPMLTPRYAAPEQIAGLPVTAATDVYSAGVVLYELLTGQHPQVGPEDPGLGALLQAVLHQPARPPGLGRDLDTILLKALAKVPADRYASAERLAEDLRRLQAHEPILARRVPAWRRLLLLGRRWPRVTALGALAFGLLSASLAVAWQQRQASTAQAARAAAVRDFMFDMVSDAEADEGRPEGEVTGADMVQAALRRARQDFAAQPLLQGELLGELGRMAARLGRPDVASQALAEAVERLQGRVPPDHPPLNKARAHLAGRLLGRDDSQAERLARQVLADCADPRPDCTKARLYAHDVLMLWHSQQGRDDLALVEARAVVRESTQAFGAADANTAVAWQSLATVARNDGRLMEAQAAVAQALAIARPLTLRQSARRGLRLTDAVLALDLGRYVPADQALGELVADAPDAAERAMALRLQAVSRLNLGQGEAAARLAEQAAGLAQEAGDTLEQVLALAVAGRAWALHGRPAMGLTWLAQADTLLRAPGMPPAPQQSLQLQRFMAEARLRAGELAEAQAALGRTPDAEWLAAPALERAHWLDLRGRLATAEGRPGEALAWHAQARAQMVSDLPADHPWLARNQIYTAWALALKDGGSAARQQARSLVQAFAQRWPQPSAWTAAAAHDGPPLLL